MKKIIELYNSGKTDNEMAEILSMPARTIRDHLRKLRTQGVIDYRKYLTKSKVMPKVVKKTDEDSYVDESELLKLLAIYKTREEVAKHLRVSTHYISKLCKEYNIMDTKYLSIKIIDSLKSVLNDIEPYKIIKNKKNNKGDTLVIQLTDIHAGKIIKDQEGNLIYNEEICKARIDKFCSQILKLLDNNIKKGVPITDVVIISTGDNANGENIYRTQAYEQELAPPKQVMLVVEMVTKLIVALLERKLPVRFYGVRGNHGRTSKDSDVTSNWDIMIYEILKLWAHMIKDPKLSVEYSETDYMTLEIRGHNYLIRHIAPEQPDTSGGRVKFNEWARQHNVDAIVFGHFHHFGLFDCDGIRIFRGGSVPGGDSLSESMAKNSNPIQLIWGVNENRVSTFFYPVDLANE